MNASKKPVACRQEALLQKWQHSMLGPPLGHPGTDEWKAVRRAREDRVYLTQAELQALRQTADEGGRTATVQSHPIEQWDLEPGSETQADPPSEFQAMGTSGASTTALVPDFQDPQGTATKNTNPRPDGFFLLRPGNRQSSGATDPSGTPCPLQTRGNYDARTSFPLPSKSDIHMLEPQEGHPG